MIPSLLPTYNRAPLSFVSGEGSWLTEADGRRFLDLGAGIAVNALGHANPALVGALTEQAGKLWHLSNLYQIPQQQALAEKLVEETFADTVFFTNSLRVGDRVQACGHNTSVICAVSYMRCHTCSATRSPRASVRATRFLTSRCYLDAWH